MKIQSLAISIPAYNDQNTIGKVIKDSISVASKIADDWEIVVIDDGSTDETFAVINEVAKKCTRIRVFRHEVNKGFGKTIKEVYTIPDKEWVIFLPGDDQCSAKSIYDMSLFTGKHDFIIGRRKKRNDNLKRRISSRIYNVVVSKIAGHRVHDVNSIALIRRRIIIEEQLKSKSAFIHAELFLVAAKNGYKPIEVDVVHKDRQYGQGGGGRLDVIGKTIFELICYVIRS
jgi:glycosyltransferase involved in cell wall biosynthesis